MGKYLKQGVVKELEYQLNGEEISYSKWVNLMEEECIKNYKTEIINTKNFKYIIKDNLNTYIKMVDNLGEVSMELERLSYKFKDTYSTFGASLDGSPTFEDSAVYRIPEDMRLTYGDFRYIKFYFFKFDIQNNKLVDLYE